MSPTNTNFYVFRVIPPPLLVFEFLSIGKVSASFVHKCAQHFNVCARFLFEILEHYLRGAEKSHVSG